MFGYEFYIDPSRCIGCEPVSRPALSARRIGATR